MPILVLLHERLVTAMPPSPVPPSLRWCVKCMGRSLQRSRRLRHFTILPSGLTSELF